MAARDGDVEYLIGDQHSRWWALAGAWLAIAVSVAFGLSAGYAIQGLDVGLRETLMALNPHYLFWVLVSPPLYRSLHRTLQGPNRVFWAGTLVAWSGIALAGSAAVAFFSYIVRHDLRPTLVRLLEIYFMPPAGPAFWAMNLSILAIALAAFAAVRSHRLQLHALWQATQKELLGARLEAELSDARLLALQAQLDPHYLWSGPKAIESPFPAGERGSAFDAIGHLACCGAWSAAAGAISPSRSNRKSISLPATVRSAKSIHDATAAFSAPRS